LQEISEPDHRGVEFEAGEVALGRLVEACGDAVPVLQPVDQSLDGVAVTVKIGVEGDGTAAPATPLLACVPRNSAA
jgi:hypothetical protein